MEQVMVVEQSVISTNFGSNSASFIAADEQAFLAAVQAKCIFRGRDLVENDPSYKQIISYCVILSGEHVFVTRRTKKQTEKRLHDKMSLGIGGHVSEIDKGPDLVMRGLRRELEEEVYIRAPYTMRYLGVINDDSNEVGSVHTGVCYAVEVQAGDCEVREKEKMVGQWMTRPEIEADRPYFEEWSRIVIDSLWSKG